MVTTSTTGGVRSDSLLEALNRLRREPSQRSVVSNFGNVAPPGEDGRQPVRSPVTSVGSSRREATRAAHNAQRRYLKEQQRLQDEEDQLEIQHRQRKRDLERRRLEAQARLDDEKACITDEYGSSPEISLNGSPQLSRANNVNDWAQVSLQYLEVPSMDTSPRYQSTPHGPNDVQGQSQRRLIPVAKETARQANPNVGSVAELQSIPKRSRGHSSY